MSKREKISIVGVVFLSAFFYGSACGQEPPAAPAAVEQPVAAQPVAVPQQEPASEKSTVTLDFKDADIQNVLRVLAYKSGVNIVTGKEVVGTVTIRLVDVPWEQALDVILNTYGFAYEREGNIITVSTVDALKERREKKKELTEIEGVSSRVFNLQYLDAQDAKKMLEPQLSPQGKISVLEVTGQKGWKIGVPQAGGQSTDEGKERRERENSRSRSLVVTDTLTYLDRMSKILKEMDVKPVQILIEARIMEVSKNVLRDIGMEWSTGSRLQNHQALTTAGVLNGGVKVKFGSASKTTGTISGSNYSQSEPTDPLGYQPSNFNPLSTNLNPYNAGLQLLYQKLFGTQMEAMVHALEEDVRTNTLSAPKILTLSGQEAIILIGTKYPIVESSISGTSGTATENLAYYQDIGVQLYVVPQVSGDEKFINMIVHPVISERTALTVGLNDYPVIDTRETETQILMADGETIVIGGLLRNVKSKSRIGIPILGDIPVIGNLFSRATNNTDKIDLLIFITARVVRPGEFTDQEMAMVKQALEAGQANVTPAAEPEKKEKKKEDKKKEKPAAPVAAEGFSKSNRGYLSK
ncbi:MAG: secretin and TonB N-terminal domain-containing protein [Candidatus Omnitrophica bacterium]|nr:secretin and TonB N-terminal domain-containing protein [Candidatus Omnitrophota bacterium]MDD5310401.1 secretin and TonB N-terminal domain-containing protein [Candidatus Omnitrophota bacterium]MDD5546755.1 secretin and TonB N-terminal domain-containing protein [Candidatus Omnitrophota bacterium]